MIWKTDWTSEDNYARAGAADLARLLDNYERLKQLINAEYGLIVEFTAPTLNGFATMPFSGLLNSVEDCLQALHVWVVEWTEKTGQWQTGQSGPSFEDINRWERNGWAIEDAARRIREAWYYMGEEIYMGEVTS